MTDLQFRRIGINENINPDISVTLKKDGRYHLFSEKSGLNIGDFSKEYLLNRKTFSEYQLKNIKGTTNFVALNKSKPKSKKIKWGFDLTGFDSAAQFERLLERNGFDPVKSFKEIQPYKEYPEITHFQWSNKFLKIITGNNPITGEYSNPKHRKPEKGYASYIGIEGYEFHVKKLVDDIKKTTNDIKNESKRKREYI